MWEGLPRGARFFAAFFPPDFTSRWAEIAEGIMESLWMTVISTVIGIALSVPIGIGAAKNIAPAPVYYFCRGILAVSRSFQEIILAIFFVKLFGFGPFAGVVTLSVATIGFYGKLLAEDIEDMDPAQAEAVRATGAGWLQWINYGVQPQVMPRMIGLGLYRFDINFRESAVVGIVGGGGIGATLNTAFDRYEFDSAAAILLIIIAIVMVVEYSLRLHAALGAVMAVAVRGETKVWQRARARRAVRRLGGVARGRVDLRLLLAAHLRKDDLGVRHRRAGAGRRSRRADDPAGLGLHQHAVAADLGHHQYRHARHADRHRHRRFRSPTARRATPRRASLFVRPIALFIIVSSRSINSLIWALMLVTIIGPGVLAGILSIALRSIGFCAKLLYEAIEEIDEGQVEAVRATGASGAQVTTYGIVPQVMPAFAGISVFRWDINIREFDGAGAGRRRRHRPAAERGDHHADMDAGVADPAGHHRDGGGERMGVGEGAARDHLTARDSIWTQLQTRRFHAPRRPCRRR